MSFIFCLLIVAGMATVDAIHMNPSDVTARRQTACSLDDFRQCAEPARDFIVSFGLSQLEELTKPANLDNLCTQLNSTISCVTQCELPENSAWIFEMYEGVAGYMCSSEGKDVILTETSCLKELVRKNVLQPCYETFVAATEEDKCLPLDELGECVPRVVKESCNDKAATFAGVILSRYLLPLKPFAGCDAETEVKTSRRDIHKLLSWI